MTLDEFIEELGWCKGTYFQNLYIKIDGKEYKIQEAYAISDPVETNCCELMEDENHRIVFEFGKDN